MSSEKDYPTTATIMRSTADRLLRMRRRLNEPILQGERRRLIENVDEVVQRLIQFYEQNNPGG